MLDLEKPRKTTLINAAFRPPVLGVVCFTTIDGWNLGVPRSEALPLQNVKHVAAARRLGGGWRLREL